MWSRVPNDNGVVLLVDTSRHHLMALEAVRQILGSEVDGTLWLYISAPALGHGHRRLDKRLYEHTTYKQMTTFNLSLALSAID